MNEHVYTKAELNKFRKGSGYGARLWDGIPYVGFSVERKDMGGYVSKKEAIDEFRKLGIRFTFRDDYTPYVGHWGIHVEAYYEEAVSDYFFRGDSLEDAIKKHGLK